MSQLLTPGPTLDPQARAGARGPGAAAGVDIRPVQTLDDARRVGDLVYSTYGLTYHRALLYDPARILELIAQGALSAVIAVDPQRGDVVGHQAALRPWFELAAPLPPGRGAPVLEDGLSIVHPAWRGRGLQGALAMALYLHEAPRNPDLRGVITRCMTTTLASQRTARRFQGRPVCVFLAGVPAWVVVDQADPHNREPLTTLAMYCPLADSPPREVRVPARLWSMLAPILGPTGLGRTLVPVEGAPPASGPTGVATWFDPARRQGVIRVLRVGEDLASAVLARLGWMRGGHLEHITVLLPMDSLAAMAQVPSLTGQGLFVGGVVPDLEGVDTLVLEWTASRELDLDRIQVLGEDGRALLDQVVEGWRRSR